jgi:hypothetical protein
MSRGCRTVRRSRGSEPRFLWEGSVTPMPWWDVEGDLLCLTAQEQVAALCLIPAQLTSRVQELDHDPASGVGVRTMERTSMMSRAADL